MAQLRQSKVDKAFGEVNVWRLEDGRIRIKATVLMKPNVENSQTGLALDGSRSMQDMYGFSEIGLGGGFFDEPKPNYMQPVARKIAAFLANFDSDGETTATYFACDNFGAAIEPIGEISEEGAATQEFVGPQKWGKGTQLLPAINYFLERFQGTPWLICLFITDGLIDDLEDVKMVSKKICEEMRDDKRGFTKFVIIGLGKDFKDPNSRAVKALEELDDLDDDPEYGVEGQDLWDHKLAMDMRTLEEIFAEVVSEQTIIARSAEVLDSHGNNVVPEEGGSYSDGLPALLRFTMPADSTSFAIVLPNGKRLEQDISSFED